MDRDRYPLPRDQLKPNSRIPARSLPRRLKLWSRGRPWHQELYPRRRYLYLQLQIVPSVVHIAANVWDPTWPVATYSARVRKLTTGRQSTSEWQKAKRFAQHLALK